MGVTIRGITLQKDEGEEYIIPTNGGVWTEQLGGFTPGESILIKPIWLTIMVSCSGYNRFRNQLAEMLGVKANPTSSTYPYLFQVFEENLDIPFKYLLNFSDSEGFIAPEFCKVLAGEFKQHANLRDGFNVIDQTTWDQLTLLFTTVVDENGAVGLS